MPLFSIIIPTFNRAHVIQKAIDSVLQQTFLDFELMIVDDGSEDMTEGIINTITDERLKYFKRENQGVCAARNFGAEKAAGEYLVFLDSDDLLTNDAIKNFHNQIVFQRNDIIFSDLELHDLISKKTSIISSRYPYGNKQSNGFFMSGTFAISKSLFLKVGGYDPLIKYGENTELKLRLEKIGYSYGFTDQIGLIYFKSEEGGSQNLLQQAESNEYMIAKHADFFEKHPKVLKLYRQNMAIAYCKMGNMRLARLNIWKAFISYPFDPKTFFRLLIMWIPVLAKKTWSIKR